MPSMITRPPHGSTNRKRDMMRELCPPHTHSTPHPHAACHQKPHEAQHRNVKTQLQTVYPLQSDSHAYLSSTSPTHNRHHFTGSDNEGRVVEHQGQVWAVSHAHVVEHQSPISGPRSLDVWWLFINTWSKH